MNGEIEKRFVYSFLENRIRERIIFELASDKKRRTAIYRFCHATEDIVKSNCIYRKTKDVNLVLSEIHILTNSKSCYVISSNDEIDGTETTIENAISSCIGLWYAVNNNYRQIACIDRNRAMLWRCR